MRERSTLAWRPAVAGRTLRRLPVETAPGPIVKWVGGKTKLLGELLARMPETYGRYHEPFVGGGALFFALQPRQAVLSDANPELIACYMVVRADVEGVIAALAVHRDRHSVEHYYETRAAWNAGREPAGSAARAASFIYLNRTCFNGLWRVNSRGEFNVPAGRYARPLILDEDRLRVASRALAGVHLKARSFEHVLDDAVAGDLVYFDPPYDPVSDTSDFTSYTAGAFGRDDQRRLAEVFDELAARGCHVILSNSDTAFVRGLYRKHRVEQVFCGRAINSRPDGRGQVPEIICTAPW